MVDAVTALARLGGTATYRQLLAETTRRSLRTAVERGTVLRPRGDRYASPGTDPGVLQALALGGALSGPSAAVARGWGVVREPDQLHVTVPRGAAPGPPPAQTVLRWDDLTDHERTRGITGPVRTVVDCARLLPVPDGLAVADSALRSGTVLREELQATRVTGSTGAARSRLVLARADERAANPFESALRGLLLEAGLTSFVPQLLVSEPGLVVVVDLGDPVARVALEADGYAVHGTRRAFAADLRRHDDLQAAGWVTRRFAYEHVMFDPGWVVAQVRSALEGRPPGRTIRRRRAA